jgi:hypothetical protein
LDFGFWILDWPRQSRGKDSGPTRAMLDEGMFNPKYKIQNPK